MIGSGVDWWCTRPKFRFKINAPHGGIIVILATDFSHFHNIACISCSTLISALLYGFLKPKVTENEIQASEAMDE